MALLLIISAATAVEDDAGGCMLAVLGPIGSVTAVVGADVDEVAAALDEDLRFDERDDGGDGIVIAEVSAGLRRERVELLE